MARAKQYADRVNIIKRIKLGSKWPLAPVVERNGRIVRAHVWVAGRDEHHPEGRYYLEWYEEGRRPRKALENYDLVVPAARAKSIELKTVKAGLMALPEPPAVQAEPARLPMDAAIDQYLEYIRKDRSLRTYRTYRPVLHVHFRNSYMKTYVEEMDRSNILKFVGDLFDCALIARTVYDRLVVVLQLFKRHGYKSLVERSVRSKPSGPSTNRKGSRHNHREAIAAMDFFTAPTVTLGVLYCSSLSRTTGGESFTSTSPNVRQALGWHSKFAKRFPMIRRRNI